MKIEVGKRYHTRNGGVSGVIASSDGSDYPFWDGYDEYTVEGRYWSDSREHAKDLIKEYVEPTTEIPGLEGYRVVRYGRVTTGELYVGVGGVKVWNMPKSLETHYLVVEKLAPAKRTIVFKETFTRYGNRWSLDWLTEGDWPDELVPPDEQIYTGNERTVEV